MSEREISGLINENINSPITTSTICDLTGEEIGRVEPHFTLFGEIIASFEGLEKMFLSGKKITDDGFKVETVKNVSPKTCNFCRRKVSDNIELYKKKNREFERVTVLCNECWDDFFDKCESEIEKIHERLHYFNSAGFRVSDYNEPWKFKDDLTLEDRESKNVITIGCNDVGNFVLHTHLSNLEELIGIFYTPRNHKFSERCQVIDCDVCGLFSKNGCKIKTVKYRDNYPQFCNTCINNLYIELKDYLDDNKEYIISRTL